MRPASAPVELAEPAFFARRPGGVDQPARLAEQVDVPEGGRERAAGWGSSELSGEQRLGALRPPRPIWPATARADSWRSALSTASGVVPVGPEIDHQDQWRAACRPAASGARRGLRGEQQQGRSTGAEPRPPKGEPRGKVVESGTARGLHLRQPTTNSPPRSTGAASESTPRPGVPGRARRAWPAPSAPWAIPFGPRRAGAWGRGRRAASRPARGGGAGLGPPRPPVAVEAASRMPSKAHDPGWRRPRGAGPWRSLATARRSSLVRGRSAGACVGPLLGGGDLVAEPQPPPAG